MKLASAQLDAQARRLLGRGYRELAPEQRRVLIQIVRRGLVSRNLASDESESATRAERLADMVSRIGGSWAFLLGFLIFLCGWVLLNGFALLRMGVGPFDPHPYILLNLGLSMLAAIQAPVIMMALNRQAEKDRQRAEHDYEVNLKAELEIMALNDRLDALRERELADILAHQVELLQELRDRPRVTAA